MKGDGRDENNLGDFQILKLNFWAQGHWIIYIPSKKFYLFLSPKYKAKMKWVFIVHLQVCQKKVNILSRLGRSNIKNSLLLIHIWYSEIFHLKVAENQYCYTMQKQRKIKKIVSSYTWYLRLVWLQKKFFLGRQTASFRTHIPPLGKDPYLR